LSRRRNTAAAHIARLQRGLHSAHPPGWFELVSDIGKVLHFDASKGSCLPAHILPSPALYVDALRSDLVALVKEIQSIGKQL